MDEQRIRIYDVRRRTEHEPMWGPTYGVALAKLERDRYLDPRDDLMPFSLAACHMMAERGLLDG